MSLFADSQVESNASGQPNVPMVLFTKQINGGAITLGNGLRMTAHLRSPFASDVDWLVKLGNVTLLSFAQGAGQDDVVEFLVWRTSGQAGGWRINAGTVQQSTVFNWPNAQQLTITATSGELGGAVLENVFVER